jgi:hypothetical protein
MHVSIFFGRPEPAVCNQKYRVSWVYFFFYADFIFNEFFLAAEWFLLLTIPSRIVDLCSV